MRFALTLLFLLVLNITPSYSFDMYAVTPSEIFPGSEISVKGTGFTDDVAVILGEAEISPVSVERKLIKLAIPDDIEPGIYKLFLKSGDNKTAPLILTIRKKEIQVTGHSPESIDMCGDVREISITGDNLTEVRRINVNGQDIRDFNATKAALVFFADDSFVKPGITNLNVYLFDDRSRVNSIVTVKVNSTPVIERIEPLNSSVTFYSLRISGRNFINGMRLFANNAMIIQSPASDPSFFGSENLVAARRIFISSPSSDRFEFVSCRELVYYRYPLTSEDRQLIIHIELPGGEKSNNFTLTTP